MALDTHSALGYIILAHNISFHFSRSVEKTQQVVNCWGVMGEWRDRNGDRKSYSFHKEPIVGTGAGEKKDVEPMKKHITFHFILAHNNSFHFRSKCKQNQNNNQTKKQQVVNCWGAIFRPGKP